jgi:hypothetical protein
MTVLCSSLGVDRSWLVSIVEMLRVQKSIFTIHFFGKQMRSPPRQFCCTSWHSDVVEIRFPESNGRAPRQASKHNSLSLSLSKENPI